MRKILVTVVFLALFSGCSVTHNASESVKISSLRPAPTGIQTVELTISKNDLSNALEGSRGSSNLRIVPLVTSAAQAPASPEYRIFNVKPGSVGALIGLKNADILVAAHDYVIQAPSQFYNYLQMLRAQEASSIEIRRDGKPIRIQLQFSM